MASVVVLKSGDRLPADVVVLGIGVRPESSLAKEAGLEIVSRRGNPYSDDLPWVVRGELEEIPFQVFSPRRGTPFSTVAVSPTGEGGKTIPVVGIEDLLRLKLEAGGPKDLWDAARLLRRYPDHVPRAIACASSLGLETELRRWLERE